VLDAGHLIAFDPALWVDLSHSWKGGAAELYSRHRRLAKALSRIADPPPYGAREGLREWWAQTPDDRHSRSFHRFVNYRRMAGLAGKYVGSRRSRRS
jgi:hypothetical protein